MRTGYAPPPPDARPKPGQSRRARRLVQLGILAYWAPCLGIDAYVLWQWRDVAAGYSFSAMILMREAVAFLALWFFGSLAPSILFGGSSEARPRRRRKSTKAKRATMELSTLNRDRRGG